MPSWEFLIQREGDRGWKSIKTGNLQLLEGKYRIVANTHLTKSEVQTRITHQTTGVEPPKRRSRTRSNVTNSEGLMVVMPFKALQPGIWQFVCSGGDEPSNAWHQILKLKVLPRVQSPPPPPPAPTFATATTSSTAEVTSPLTPTNPENWSGELDRLLEQLVSEDRPIEVQKSVEPIAAQPLQIQPITTNPDKVLVLEREEFDVMPDDRFTVYGSCNLRLFGENMLRKVVINKLLICLRNPETAEMLVSIESPLTQTDPAFAFSGQLTVPHSLTTDVLLGEVNLYDSYNIQLGSTCFRVNVNLEPQAPGKSSLPDRPEELPFWDSLDRDRTPAEILDQIGRELGVTETLPDLQFPIDLPDVFGKEPPSPQNPVQDPYVPAAYQREFMFDNHHPVIPAPVSATHELKVRAASSSANRFTKDRTITQPAADSDILSGELLLDREIDLSAPILDRPLNSYDPDTLEVVVED